MCIRDRTYTYDELLGLEFRLVTNPEFYEKENGIWTDKSDDKIYMTKVVEMCIRDRYKAYHHRCKERQSSCCA